MIIVLFLFFIFATPNLKCALFFKRGRDMYYVIRGSVLPKIVAAIVAKYRRFEVVWDQNKRRAKQAPALKHSFLASSSSLSYLPVCNC